MAVVWDRNLSTQRFTQQGPPSSTGSAVGGASAAASLIQGVAAIYVGTQQRKTSKIIAESNARMADRKARDATRRGRELESKARSEGSKLIGSQRAAAAAQGINVNRGSARDIQEETKTLTELDALTIRNNARMEAFGYRSEAISSSLQGKLSGDAAMARGVSTAMSSGVRAAKWYYKHRSQ